MTDTSAIPIQGIHHIRLTVTDVARSQAFYTEVLGFQVAREIPAGVLLRNGSIILGLGPAFDPAASPPDDRFNENRVGLDHLSFQVGSYADLQAALETFDARGVPHGEIKDIGVAHVLAFRDPDNIQLELGVSRA
ncbi:MAG: VOC family protein [Chloroflexota bacterium]